MRRLITALLLACMAFVVTIGTATADPGPAFHMGFAALADQIPDVAGTPLEQEHYGPNGDSLQRTTTGLMVWRKADNWTAFTDGATTWINGAVGAVSRPNTQRFPWEGGPQLIAAPAPAPAVAQQPVRPTAAPTSSAPVPSAPAAPPRVAPSLGLPAGIGLPGDVHVRGYYRKDGTYVAPHYRTAPDSSRSNNYSHKGNVNPYTGKRGTKR